MASVTQKTHHEQQPCLVYRCAALSFLGGGTMWEQQEAGTSDDIVVGEAAQWMRAGHHRHGNSWCTHDRRGRALPLV